MANETEVVLAAIVFLGIVLVAVAVVSFFLGRRSAPSLEKQTGEYKQKLIREALNEAEDGIRVERGKVEEETRKRELDRRDWLRVQELRMKATESAMSRSSPLIAGMDALTMKLEELKNKVVGKGELRTLAADEHEEVMLNLFGKAKEEVIIVSPWVKANKLSVLDPSFDALLQKGVMVRIGFSMAPWTVKESDPEAFFFLFDKASKYENFRVYGLADTHEKVLIVDDSDAIITSYNWLSRYGSKKERGVHFTNPMLVQNEKARCMTEFVDSRLMRSYTGIPEKVENYGSHCVLRLKGCPLPILVAGLPLERMAWLQQRIDEKAQLEVLCGSPTNNNLLFLAARKIGG